MVRAAQRRRRFEPYLIDTPGAACLASRFIPSAIAPAAWRCCWRSAAPRLISPPICARLPGDGFLTARIPWRTRPACSQSLNGKRAKVLVNPRRPSVDVLNDNTGGLLRSRVRRHTYAVKFPHEAEANNNPRTEVHTRRFFFGL